MKHDKRPVNLALTTLRFPITAIISILHRVSGLLLFLSLPFVLYLFQQSLASIEDFDSLQDCFQSVILRLVVWVVLSALWYHLIAGIRHLLMDWGVGESKTGGRIGARIVLVFSMAAILLTGIWLW
ncbi:MAG: succinate dehydrogenase, cytochrome b556 subunit [Gammaproteobacteria bacterium]|nr:succinate dehydrogenase, cytochrome b556 subunit [Gammaproteobacteria bacterium]